MKTCLDSQTDVKTLVKASVSSSLLVVHSISAYSTSTHVTQNEFFRRLEQTSPSIVPTMSTFMRRATLHIVNQSCIPTFLKRIQSQKSSSSSHSQSHPSTSTSTHSTSNSSTTTADEEHARQWLVYMAKHNPAMYKLHVAELGKVVASADERNAQSGKSGKSGSGNGSGSEGVVEVALQALAAVVEWDDKLVPNDK